ncbi:MAG: RNA polymerase sigma-70 factor [Balneolaceae bacterium]|nr:RNA polymerase sigma-70 factor [Balneolaceae bacterium]MBO6547326.1 RNA polymerase sigma-70 factor [Balneolaceae bacterium]MBO6647727.1 RNA polymerase sigma-70 factor [Balneolaceae bacterium]
MNMYVLYLLFLLAVRGTSEQDDPELLIAIKNGDHSAFKTFFEKHHSFLYHFLLKKGVSEQQAEDLVQQAFVMIWDKRDTIDETKSLRSYLFRIAYTRMLNVFRDTKKFDENADFTTEESGHETDQQVETQELGEAIEASISSMPEKRQAVFRLCFIQEFTYKEAAETLDVSVKTIENHMGLALKELRGKLERFR